MASPTDWAAQLAPALAFDKTQFATGPVTEDPFYTIEPAWADAEPGTVLRVENMDPGKYVLPPATAGSRIIYQSENFHGDKTPTSGVVLFPYSAGTTKAGHNRVVIWAHGTSGQFANAAPSHYRNLWQHHLGPFPLVLQGCIVVMPDYAGLGVGVDGKGKPLVHEYLASPAHAKDMEFAFKAARAAFPDVGPQFVVIGHSQGGGAAWSFAERMHKRPIEGYLGAIPIAPVTRYLKDTYPVRPLFGAAVLLAVKNMFPDFDENNILTEEGKERVKAHREIGGNGYTTRFLYWEADLFKPGWENNEYMQRFVELTYNGGKPVKGPLLIIQGDADTAVTATFTTAAVKTTASVNPTVSIEYATYANVEHVPILTASQQLWLDWIDARFNGDNVGTGLVTSHMKPLRSIETYSLKKNWYPALATEPYQG